MKTSSVILFTCICGCVFFYFRLSFSWWVKLAGTSIFRKIWLIDWLLYKFRLEFLPQHQTRQQSLITKRFQTDFSLHFFKNGNLGLFKKEKLAQNWQQQILLFSVKFKKGFGVWTPLQTMLFNYLVYLFSDDGLCDCVDYHLPSCDICGVCNHQDNQS